VNQIKRLAEGVDPLPYVECSPDPKDDFLLALSEAGSAEYLVTGDKSGLLALGRHKGTWIVSATDFLALFAGILPALADDFRTCLLEHEG
jgi:uncharacterized protein